MGSVDPVRDREVINIELGLADLASVEKRLDKTARTAKSGDAQAKARAARARGRARRPGRRPARARRDAHRRGSRRPIRSFNLLTAKPVLYAANVAEDEIAAGNAHVEALRGGARRRPRDRRDRPLLRQGRGRAGRAAAGGPGGVPRVAGAHRIRARPAGPRGLPPARPPELLHGRREGGPRLDHPPRRHARRPPRASSTRTSRRASSGPRRWRYEDFVRVGGWKPAREQGLARAEGKEYVVRDGDVMLFRFSS